MDRTKEVRVGESYSKIYLTNNAVPPGSVSSPILFNIMMSNVFFLKYNLRSIWKINIRR